MRCPWPDLLRPRIAARQKQSFDRQADHSKKKQFFLKQGVDILLLIADAILLTALGRQKKALNCVN